MQEPMRHSSLRFTIDIYTQGSHVDKKRRASRAVLSLDFPHEPHVKAESRSKKGPNTLSATARGAPAFHKWSLGTRWPGSNC